MVPLADVTETVLPLPRALTVLPDGYIGRPIRASPGEGYSVAHAREQERIVLTALTPGA